MALVRVTGPAARQPLVAVLAVTLAVAAGCRDEAPPPAETGATEPPSTEVAGGYELDVIAEAEPDEGAPPLAVQFRGYVEEDEGGPWRFAWDFGDGATSSERNPTHTYERVGDYTATLTATDERGNTGSDEIDIFVERD